jgi:hypothetical protein
MVNNRLSKSFRIILAIVGGISLITAFALLAGWLDSPLSQVIAEMAQRRVGSNWPGYFRKGGMILLVVGITVLLSEKVIDEFNRLLKQGMAWAEMTDRWLDNKTKMLLNTPEAETSAWPLHLNRWDALIILFFCAHRSCLSTCDDEPRLSHRYPQR